MTDSTRRSFLKYTGAGAAAAAVAVAVPTAVADERANHAATGEDTTVPGSVPGSFMALVDDVNSGRLTVLLEGREVVVEDQALVARLAQAVHRHA